MCRTKHAITVELLDEDRVLESHKRQFLEKSTLSSPSVREARYSGYLFRVAIMKSAISSQNASRSSPRQLRSTNCQRIEEFTNGFSSRMSISSRSGTRLYSLTTGAKRFIVSRQY